MELTTEENELDRLNTIRKAADARVIRAENELAEAQRDAELWRAKYRRQALWIRADELRRELARVENEAGNISV
jgi:hypothetical protein